MPIYLIDSSYWKGLIEWMRAKLISLGTIAQDDLNLFKIVDDIEIIPAEIKKYHDQTSDKAGFKIPTPEDKKRSEGK